MRITKKLVMILGGAALLIAAFFWMLTIHGPLAPVNVELGTVVRAELKPEVFGIGSVEARQSYTVGPIVPGRVLRVLVDQGDEVKAGQLLAEMDPVDLDQRVDAAKSAGERSREMMKVADAQVAEAASRAKLAAMNRDRDLDLYRQNAINKQVVDNSTTEAERAAAALAAAQGNATAVRQDIARMEAESKGVGSVRASLRLLSPVDGVVVSRDAEVGSTLLAGQPVYRIVVRQSLWVRARIDQSRAQRVDKGQPASIVLRSSPQTILAGHVARIELQSDPVTEERIVDVSFDSAPPELYLGELAEVTIQLPTQPGVLALPSAAVAQNQRKAGVWKIDAGRTVFAPVSIGVVDPSGMTEIRTGLSENDRVIVYSSAQLTAGVRVRERQIVKP